MVNCFYMLINSADSFAAYLGLSPHWCKIFFAFHFYSAYFALLGVALAVFGLPAIALFLALCTAAMLFCMRDAVEMEE